MTTRGVCSICGCTDLKACLGGCWWINPEHTICSKCMETLGHDPRNLQRCFACDEWFDPSYLDQTMYHLVAACCDWELVAFPWTGIRGTKVAEKAQG